MGDFPCFHDFHAFRLRTEELQQLYFIGGKPMETMEGMEDHQTSSASFAAAAGASGGPSTLYLLTGLLFGPLGSVVST